MKWIGQVNSVDAPSLNTPVVTLNSPFSDHAKTLTSSAKKRKLDKLPEPSCTEVAFGTSALPVAGETMVKPINKEDILRKASYLIQNQKKKEWLSLQMQRAIIADEDGDRPIHIAVAQENIGLTRFLCLLMKTAGANLDVINFLRQTPLHVAVIVGNDEIVKILLANKASIHLRDKRGNTPLHLAIKYFHSDGEKRRKVLQALLTHPRINTILNETDYQGLTAMHEAVFQRNEQAVRDLWEAGANVDVGNGTSGRTSLSCAVLAQDLEMVDLLLKCGASVEKSDYSGHSSLDLALQTGNKTLIRVLEKKINKSSESSSYQAPKPCIPDESKKVESRKTNLKSSEKRKRKMTKKS